MPKVQVAMETGEGGMETLYILIYRSTLINLAIKFAVNFTLLHAFSRNQLYKIISKCSECCALSPRKTSSFTALECTEATTASKDIFLSGCSCFSNWKGILRKQLRQWVSLVHHSPPFKVDQRFLQISHTFSSSILTIRLLQFANVCFWLSLHPVIYAILQQHVRFLKSENHWKPIHRDILIFTRSSGRRGCTVCTAGRTWKPNGSSAEPSDSMVIQAVDPGRLKRDLMLGCGHGHHISREFTVHVQRFLDLIFKFPSHEIKSAFEECKFIKFLDAQPPKGRNTYQGWPPAWGISLGCAANLHSTRKYRKIMGTTKSGICKADLIFPDSILKPFQFISIPFHPTHIK